jgi:hypothetical protein
MATARGCTSGSSTMRRGTSPNAIDCGARGKGSSDGGTASDGLSGGLVGGWALSDLVWGRWVL